MEAVNLRQQVKQNAKLALKGHYDRAIGGLCVLLLVALVLGLFGTLSMFIVVLSGINDATYLRILIGDIQILVYPVMLITIAIISLFYFLVMSPLMLGFVKWYYHLTNGIAAPVSTLFCYFSSVKLFFRSVWYAVVIGVKNFFYSFFFMLPASLLVGSASYILIREGYRASENIVLMATLLMLLGALLGAMLGVLGVIFLLRYFASSVLVVEDDQLSVVKAIRQSIRTMKGERANTFLFILSFLPWFLLCIFIFPLLYVLPYFMTSRVIYSRYLMEKYRVETNPVVRSEVLSPNTEDTVVSPAPMSNVPLSEPVPSVTVYSPSAVPVNHRKQAGEKTDSEAIPFTEPVVREEGDGALEEQKSEAVCEDFPLDKEDLNQSSIAETPISAEEGFSISDGTQDETICSLNFTEKPTSEDTEETSPQPPCE